MANLDQFKLPDKAAAATYTCLNLNENYSHLDNCTNNHEGFPYYGLPYAV